MFKQLDHFAIVVHNTEESLKFYRDIMGLPVLFSQDLPDAPVKLTHLDMGNTHLQLVESLKKDHPLQTWLDEHGEGLHHFCFTVESVQEMIKTLPDHNLHSADPTPRSGPNGRHAAFINTDDTRGVLIELTSESSETSE